MVNSGLMEISEQAKKGDPLADRFLLSFSPQI
jgi:hypothetical protein